MTATIEVMEAAARAGVYTLLARGLAIPSTPTYSLLATTLLPAVETLVLPPPLREAVQTLRAGLPTDVETLRADHMVLFPPITSQDAPGYESAYRGDGIFQQAALLADIAGFYRAHGLRAGGREKERLDHITVELEFMAVLARKEALALQDRRPEDAKTCRDTARLFLQDHLGCWGPAFGRRVSLVAPNRWYQSLGTFLALWVEEEIAVEGVTPAEVVGEPLPQEPPDDGLCGPCPIPQGGWDR